MVSPATAVEGKDVLGEPASGKLKEVTVTVIPGGSGRGKRARPGPLQFLDDEAADAESEEDDVSGSEESDFIDDYGIGDELAVSKQCWPSMMRNMRSIYVSVLHLGQSVLQTLMSGKTLKIWMVEELGPTKAGPNIWKVKCMLVDFDSERERVMIKLIPRIDLQAIAQKFGGGVTCKPATVPVAQLIRPFQLKDFQTHIESRRDQQTGEILRY